MKLHRSLSYHSFGLLALSLLVAPIIEAATPPVVTPPVNKKPVAKAGLDQTVGLGASVSLNGKLSVDPGGKIVTYQWTQIGGSKLPLVNASSVIASLQTPKRNNNSKPMTLIFKLTVTDAKKAAASDTVVVNVVTGELNDTGITSCGDATINGRACPFVGYLGQDGESGRDVTRNNNLDGYRGFSFTKISAFGKTLPPSVDSWNCVKDNVTGLTWEEKTDPRVTSVINKVESNISGLHYEGWTYTWYEPVNSKNGGKAGIQGGGNCNKTLSACDTAAYVKAVNAAGWCGAKDWRLPTKEELRSILNYSREGSYEPAVVREYFPTYLDRDDSVIWTSSPYAGNAGNAWYVSSDFGYSYWADKGTEGKVRLVRSGQ
ncbi:DUF1566 domain-containing protein [Crenothrix polyspora]|uniref:Lcl C-terminal domain-containing protein n=1 Tax=Crenothrix polyspora TaxID=360316 RepID=A0A1R4H2D8_9GAMM|nr:DUF1566 domain-containing protein [Crenothrix polyspora]SJM90009.1 exported hypothetical protein [Crenothrix polyspora]